MSDELDVGSNPASEAIEPVVETEQPASSPREALERAFAKVDAPKVEAAAPIEKPAHPVDEKRHADGTFKATKVETNEAKAPAKLDAKPEAPIEPPADVKPVNAAPERFVKAAKDVWEKVPDVVRLETERAISELTAGIEKYRPDAEAFAAVKQYEQLAQQSGTTLAQALSNYVGIEQLIGQNPVAGIVQICRNRNIDPAQLGAALAGLQPQQIAQLQQQAPPQQPTQQLEPVFSRLEQMEQMLVNTQIEQFKANAPHFDELRPTIGELLKTGFAADLPDAYAKAVRLTPEVQAKIEAEKAPKVPPIPQHDPAQTRQKAALSITGSPNSGSNPATRKQAGSAREALQSAFAQVGLS